MHIELPAKSLPVLSNTDVIVLGGSFAGVAAALEFARSGRSVVLVEPRTYLGREVSATLRPWLNLSLHGSPPKMPDVVQACISESSTQAVDGEIPLHMDAVKRTLEDLLLAAKVKLIYASLPVSVYKQASKIAGVVIGNKSGRQVLLAPLVIDATENALLVRLLGGAFQSPKTKAG